MTYNFKKYLEKAITAAAGTAEKLMTANLKVAVTGLASSGKSVFILSLLQHLRYFDEHRFNIQKGGTTLKIQDFQELPVPAGFEKFPLNAMRARILAAQECKWPHKTRDSYRYRASFKYTGKLRFNDKIEIDLLDFPGDRLADVDVARYDNYAAWSDRLIEILTGDETTELYAADNADREKIKVKRLVELYLAKVRALDAPPGWLAAYKEMMTLFLHNFSHFITPSSFALDCENLSVFSAQDSQNQGRDRVCGLSGREFAPLPPDVRAKYPALAAEWADNYAVYRDQVVLRLFNYLNECGQLILMVDIPFTLAGGVQRYNALISLLESWAQILKPSKWYNPFTHLKKFAIVGTKKDLTVHEDEDNMKSLLNQIQKIVENKQPNIKCASFCVSAWVSTEEIEGQRQLKGRRAKYKPGETATLDAEGYDVWPVNPPVPWEWPDNWEAGSFSYPRTLPSPLLNAAKPPKQSGMPDVFRFIVD
ncbi:MAG: YcjX family protein [Candidatus Adiutrix sp.]|nr:YcjX family protein [Candidatus Adiutrix sp.]